MAEYVYGIVGKDTDPPSGSGLGGAPLRVIAGDSAAALVSVLDGEELRLGREEALTHARVLEEALSRGTVLPMRFGVVLASPDEVRQRILDAHSDELSAQLQQLAGMVELNVRAVYEEEELMREIVQRNPEIARRREALHGQPEDATYYERIGLGEMVAAAVEQARETDAYTMLEVLSPLARGVEVGQPAHERVVLSASFLVEQQGVDRFDQALEELARSQAGRIRVKLTGPLPAHSFVELAGTA